MAGRLRKVIWTLQARTMLDEAVAYVAEDSINSALRLLGTVSTFDSLEWWFL